MGCVFDGRPIGTVGISSIDSTAYCHDCNTSNPAGRWRVKYLGHFDQLTGRYAHIEYLPPFTCVGCGKIFYYGELPCDSSGIEEVFKQEARIDESIDNG